ncbi:MAG: hypothetical protein IPP71_18255 [Bacteroidetes bacterium]|nr:hypothetical protein [Bacteroidota bacterium]
MNEPQRDDWTMNGNYNSDPATQFIGTIDNKDVSFRTNNLERFRIKSDGKISMSTFSGAGSKIVYADSLGVLRSFSFLLSTCLPRSPIIAWQANPAIQNKVFACGIDFGIGTYSPREKLEVKGTVLVTSWDNSLNNMSDYLQLKHDGVNARIESFGTGDLLLNNGNPRNVKVNLGNGSGYFETGNNTYLATESGNVGIGISTPNYKLDVNGNINYTGELYKNGTLISDAFWSTTTTGINFGLGNVGVGTSNPIEKFQVNEGAISAVIGSAEGQGLDYGTCYFGMNAIRTGMNSWISSTDGIHNGGTILFGSISGDFNIATIPSCEPNCNTDLIYDNNFIQDNTSFKIRASDGHISMGGNPHNDYKLNVCGGIITNKVRVPAIWCDYVFEKGYELMSIDNLRQFVETNKRLPEIPSQKEIESNGVDVGSMLTLHMKKIEELTLYVLELEKRINELKNISNE